MEKQLRLLSHSLRAIDLNEMIRRINLTVVNDASKCSVSTTTLTRMVKICHYVKQNSTSDSCDPEQAQWIKHAKNLSLLIAKYFKNSKTYQQQPRRTSSNTRKQECDTYSDTRMEIRLDNLGIEGHIVEFEKVFTLQAEQSDVLADTDEVIDEQELEALYSYMAKIQEVLRHDSAPEA
ncbi:hypothetical protein Tco_1554372 [Tanacetum coccineum]